MHKTPSRETFVVHCSSAVYQPHFQDFLRREKRLDHYALLAVPGGVHGLTLDEYLPKFSWAGWRYIKFLMDLDSPSRIILIGHDECRWYQKGPLAHMVGSERARQEADLRKVAAAWKSRSPGAAVESYYATIVAGKATFDAIS